MENKTPSINNATEKFCSTCGSIINKQAEICPKCGVRQSNAPIPAKSKTVAAILALVFGGLGIHKFYLGRAVGVVYIIFCWTFIPSIIAFIEAIVYLTCSGTDREFTRKYAS